MGPGSIGGDELPGFAKIDELDSNRVFCAEVSCPLDPGASIRYLVLIPQRLLSAALCILRNRRISIMARMKVAQVEGPNKELKVVERDVPEPGPRQVRIKVEACGVCHSDVFTVAGMWPGIQYPRVPGHEVVGKIDAVGKDVPDWKTGMRVGVGWHGGHCGHCPRCRRGDFLTCVTGEVPGISYDGGYSEYMIAPFDVLAAVPDSLASAEAAPLLCAGITTFNSLRHSGARPGDLVAVLGMGGLGHLAVQFAAHMGFNTVAIARGADKGPFAKKLGAAHYIDSVAQDVAKELTKLGGAAVVLATAADAKAMTATIGGLGIDGKLVVLGASVDPIEVSPLLLIGQRRNISGWPSGTATDSEDTLKFCELSGVKAMIETYPLSKAADAYARMMSGKAKFRVVITMPG
jgi:D-arabinose 1-dehydrogenase-like Zn-dependent alcohol dehydrogenase